MGKRVNFMAWELYVYKAFMFFKKRDRSGWWLVTRAEQQQGSQRASSAITG